MRSREELREMNFEGQREIEKMADKTEDRKRRALEKIQKQADEIMGEIKVLQREKEKLYIAPMTKEELLPIAKERLRLQREGVIHRGLKDHLRACQEGVLTPFDPERIRDSFPARGLLLFFFVITEEDIEKAVAELEEGTSEEERKKKIREIDNKIARLSAQLEKES